MPEIKRNLQLNNGAEMPRLGLGVYMIPDGRAAEEAVGAAIDAGYRHIDTAAFYQNERSVGRAIRGGGLERSQIFVTTKLWNSDHGYDQALRAFNQSLDRLDLGYINLYLVHWPVVGKRLETYRALETLVSRSGKAKAIGVSNYMVRHLEELLENCSIVPAVNQIELHPFNYRSRRPVIDLCLRRGVAVVAYCPLTQGLRLADQRLVGIADKYGKTTAQILIRWGLQHGFGVIPKSARPERIRANAEVFDFIISDADMLWLDSLDEGLVTSWDPTDAP